VWFGFGFISKKPKKRTETKKNLKTPSQTEKMKPNQKNRASQTGKTEPNQFEPVFALKKPNRTEQNRNRSV
jgi:hypothetical protein